MAAVIFYYAVRDGQAKPGPFIPLLGSKKRLEEFTEVGRIDAGTGITDVNDDMHSVDDFGGNSYDPTAFTGICGIIEEIEKNLLQSIGNRIDGGQFGGILFYDRYFLGFEVFLY